MDLHTQPINERIEWLLRHASRHSSEFCSPEASLARDRYLTKHPTAIVALQCMDGRLHLPVATRTPPGIIQPFRSLGGTFDLGCPSFGEVFARHVAQMISEGRRVLVLITYHFSRGDVRRGCAGFDCDTDAAVAQSYWIKRQVEQVFGTDHEAVFPVVCGIETDEDALILHGENGDRLDLSEVMPEDAPSLALRLAAIFPTIPKQVRGDLTPLTCGNLGRIAWMRKNAGLLDIQHREWMICLGRGFDFLHTPNIALIIGSYNPNLSDSVRKAAGIIEASMQAGRIPDDGFLLLASAPYLEPRVDRARAELQSRFLATFATEVIRADFPALAKKMFIHNAVLDWHSRKLETIEAQ